MPNRDIEMTAHGYDQSVHWNGFLAIFRFKKKTQQTQKIPVKFKDNSSQGSYWTNNIADILNHI